MARRPGQGPVQHAQRLRRRPLATPYGIERRTRRLPYGPNGGHLVLAHGVDGGQPPRLLREPGTESGGSGYQIALCGPGVQQVEGEVLTELMDASATPPTA